MLSIERGRIKGGVRFVGHAHACAHLLVVADGGLVEQGDKDLHDLARGAVRLSAAGVAHNLHFGSGGADCQVLEAPSGLWRRIFERALSRAASANVYANAPIDLLAGAGCARTLAVSQDTLLSLGRILAIASGSKCESAPAWFEDVLDLIERDCAQPLLRLADTVRRDRSHLTRAFSAWCGLLPTEYRALRRAAAAADMLQRSDAPLADLALECGYADQSHLSRALKGAFGQAPGQLRRR